MASKNLQRAYQIYKLSTSSNNSRPSLNDIVFMLRFIKEHKEEFNAYVKELEGRAKVAKTDFSTAKTNMQKSHEIRTSLPKPESSNPEGSKDTQKTGQLIKQNTKAIRINNAAWRGIDAAIKDGAIDGTKVRLLEKQGNQKEAYELGVKLVREYLKDANKILDDGEKLQVDGIYGRKSKAAFTKYNEAKQAFAKDDESANPNLKNASTGDRFQRYRAYSYNTDNENLKTHSDTLRAGLRDNGYQSLDSIRNNPEFLSGLTIDSTARFNKDNAYILPDHGRDPLLLDSAVYTPRGQFINYTAGVLRMPGDTIESRHPMIIGEESYEPYLNHLYAGKRGNMLYTPIWQDGRLRTDTIGILGGSPETGRFSISPVDSIPGVYTDEPGGAGGAYAFYNSSPILNKADSGFVYMNDLLAHPEWLDSIRASANVPLDTIRPIYINTLKRGGLLKKRCKK